MSEGCLGVQVVFGWCVVVSACCRGVSGGVSWRYQGCLVVPGGCQVVSWWCFRHFFRSEHCRQTSHCTGKIFAEKKKNNGNQFLE